MIAILDYGSGNVKAFLNAYERMRIPARRAHVKGDLDGANKIILPGVGAFDTALKQLEDSGMQEAVEERVLKRAMPLLGICVGMQILANRSEEGRQRGLGWIPGEVKRLRGDGSVLRLPHMGWNEVRIRKEHRLLRDLPNGGRFYFLHSYYYECSDDADVMAECKYGQQFACAIHRGNIHAVQFHPEKSHEDGMAVLRNFAEL